MPRVTYRRGTAVLQADHPAGFCLKFRQGLDILFFSSFFLYSLFCRDKFTPVVSEPAALYANQMPVADGCQVLLPPACSCHD